MKVTLGIKNLTIHALVGIVQRGWEVTLSNESSFVSKISRGVDILEEKWKRGDVIYGVTTGVGESCIRPIPQELVGEFSQQLSRCHRTGLGAYFDEETTHAILVARLVSLVQGYSAVRPVLLETLCHFINHQVLPRIPQEGSVGASGDLTPLSYVAAALMGEGTVLFRGELHSARAVLQELGIESLKLQPKEGLAVMNGTSVMTALACLAYQRAEYLIRLGSRLTAMVSEALLGNKAHFDRRLFEAKPHPGQAKVGNWIAQELNYTTSYCRSPEERIQDTYALRCAPHILGVLADALPWMKTQIETELNSCNDNPLIDPDSGDVLHGGNFYGGHIAFVMDCMKNAVANIADLMDRQTTLLINPVRNHGLPTNLSGAPQEKLPVNHGFKAVEIATAAWTAEALKLTMPASVFSRSTESHNQDKVSLGTIAARDCVRVLDLTEQVLAGTLLVATQAIDLRIRQGKLQWQDISEGIQDLHQSIRKISAFVEEDRPLDSDLRELLNLIHAQNLPAVE